MTHFAGLVLGIGFTWSLAVPLRAQAPLDREVAGVVTNAATHAPVPGAALTVGERRTLAGPDGRFTLRAPADRVVVEVTAAGYFPLSTPLDLRDRDAVGAEFSLTPNAPFTSSVDVVAAPPPTAAPAAVAVAPSQVLRTPGALDNVFRTLQTLPGVSATEEFGSRLAVRGGAPDQNLTVMDGVEIHDPYRLFGLTSAFNPETIQRFELATGGFSVKYGDRLSSLLLVENREGTRQESLAGSASLSITDANVVFEGRLPRRATGSWLVSARRTYYDLVASRLTDQDFPRFADVQAKGVWELAPGRTLSLFGLRSRQAAALNIDDDERPGRVHGRHAQRSGVDPLRCRDWPGGAVAHDRVVFEQRLEIRRRCRVRESKPAIERPRRRRGRCRQRHLRSDAGRARHLDPAGAGVGAAARTWSRPAANCIGSRPIWSMTSAAIAIRPRPTARASKAARDCPTR